MSRCAFFFSCAAAYCLIASSVFADDTAEKPWVIFQKSARADFFAENIEAGKEYGAAFREYSALRQGQAMRETGALLLPNELGTAWYRSDAYAAWIKTLSADQVSFWQDINNAATSMRYYADPEYREQKLAQARKANMTSEAYEAKLAQQKEKYATDEAYRQQRLARARRDAMDPAAYERQLARARKENMTPEAYAAKNARNHKENMNPEVYQRRLAEMRARGQAARSAGAIAAALQSPNLAAVAPDLQRELFDAFTDPTRVMTREDLKAAQARLDAALKGTRELTSPEDIAMRERVRAWLPISGLPKQDIALLEYYWGVGSQTVPHTQAATAAFMEVPKVNIFRLQTAIVPVLPILPLAPAFIAPSAFIVAPQALPASAPVLRLPGR